MELVCLQSNRWQKLNSKLRPPICAQIFTALGTVMTSTEAAQYWSLHYGLSRCFTVGTGYLMRLGTYSKVSWRRNDGQPLLWLNHNWMAANIFALQSKQ